MNEKIILVAEAVTVCGGEHIHLAQYDDGSQKIHRCGVFGLPAEVIDFMNAHELTVDVDMEPEYFTAAGFPADDYSYYVCVWG